MIPYLFELGEEMTFATVEDDRKRLANFYKNARNNSDLIMDLRSVKHCDSAGLALLIEAKRMAKQYRCSCKIKGISEDLTALAKFCGVEEILAVNS